MPCQILKPACLFLGSALMAQASTPHFRTGAYSGASIGAVWNRTNVSEKVLPLAQFDTIVVKGKGHHRALLAEGLLGYRWFVNNMMYGLETAISMETLRTHIRVPVPDEAPIVDTPRRRFSGKILGTIGYKLNDRWLVFGKLGPIITRFSLGYKRYQTRLNPGKNLVGGSLSLGTEYALNDEWSLTGALFSEAYPSIKKKRIDPQGLDSHSTLKKLLYGGVTFGFIYKY